MNLFLGGHSDVPVAGGCGGSPSLFPIDVMGSLSLEDMVDSPFPADVVGFPSLANKGEFLVPQVNITGYLFLKNMGERGFSSPGDLVGLSLLIPRWL